MTMLDMPPDPAFRFLQKEEICFQTRAFAIPVVPDFEGFLVSFYTDTVINGDKLIMHVHSVLHSLHFQNRVLKWN